MHIIIIIHYCFSKFLQLRALNIRGAGGDLIFFYSFNSQLLQIKNKLLEIIHANIQLLKHVIHISLLRALQLSCKNNISENTFIHVLGCRIKSTWSWLRACSMKSVWTSCINYLKRLHI